MSFLVGRFAGKEAAYFFQESKHAVNRLAEKSSTSKNNAPNSSPELEAASADVLPEILRHSLPSKIFGKPADSSSLSTGSKWSLQYDPNNAPVATPDVLNPLTAYLSLPQVTFGPKRWKLPNQEHSVVASTANEMRSDRFGIIINPEKVKDASEGLTKIGQALAIATATVFGGAIVVFSLAASKLQLQNIGDIRSKVREVSGPKLEKMNDRVVPLKTWAEGMSKKWHIERTEDIKEKPLVKELSKLFKVKTST